MYRFRHRRISLVDRPSVVRRSTYARVSGSQPIRPTASRYSARLASRAPHHMGFVWEALLTAFSDLIIRTGRVSRSGSELLLAASVTLWRSTSRTCGMRLRLRSGILYAVEPV